MGGGNMGGGFGGGYGVGMQSNTNNPFGASSAT